MRYVAGIDGGQSATQAAVADERGRVLGYGDAGPADEIGAGPESTRLHDALTAALAAACRAAEIEPSASFEAIVAGVSGYEGRLYGTPPNLPARVFSLVHDPFVAHAGAFSGCSGTVVIAGTGSVAYVVDDDGCSALIGGLGYVFGDEGSAFWIARTALACAIADDANCAVSAAATRYFGQASLREVLAAFYHGAVDRERLASFAKIVLEIAASGVPDACAGETVVSAQEHLARLAARAAGAGRHWKARPRAAFTGGLLHDRFFKNGLCAAARERAPAIEIVDPAYPPVLGAVLLALRAAGMPWDRVSG